jgi:hypothetical protein
MEGIFDRSVIQWQRSAALRATDGAGRILGLTKGALHGLPWHQNTTHYAIRRRKSKRLHAAHGGK